MPEAIALLLQRLLNPLAGKAGRQQDVGGAFGNGLCRFAQMSLLNCLCAAVPARERVITCEMSRVVTASHAAPAA